MALTTGDRRNKATVSSIQSRMGVVSAYEGSGIADAAEAVSGVLNVEAERRAKQEEVQWKLDYKLKTRETITNFARNNFDNPDAFTKLTDSYIATAEEEAPVRFKNYAKEFASNLAFQEGDVIWNEADNKRKVKILQDEKINLAEFVSYRNEKIMSLSGAEEEDYWFNSLLPELADTVATYEETYNSMNATIQSTMDSPEAYKKSLLLGFETVRLISDARDMLNAAQAEDSKQIQINGKVPEDYITEVSKVQKKLDKYKKEYLKNPNFDASDSGALYTESNYNEREKILEAVQTDINNWNTSNQKNVDKQLIAIQNQKDQDLIEFEQQILNGNIQSDENLYSFLQSIDATDKQTEDLLKANNKMKIITQLASQLTKFENGSIVNLQDGMELQTTINNYKSQLSDKGIEMTTAEIKQESINMQMFNVMAIGNPDMTLQEYYSTDLMSVMDNGLANDNVLLNSIIKLSQTYGIVPDKLDEYFSSANMLNFEVVEDQTQLAVMAEFASNLQYTKGRPPSFKEGFANDHFADLVELHQSLKKVNSYDNAVRAGLTTSQLTDLEKGRTEQRRNIIELWFGQYINPDQTVLDDKVNLLDKIMEDENLDFSKMIQDFAENKQEDGPWWGFGFSDTDLLTGNNEFNIAGRDDDLENAFQFVIQEMGEELKLKVAASFTDKTYLGTMNAESIKKAYKKNLSAVLNSVRARGYGYNEND